MKNTTRKSLIVLVCLAAVTVAVVMFCAQRPPDLLDVGNRVYHGAPVTNDGHRSYTWRVPNEIIVTETQIGQLNKVFSFNLKTKSRQLLADTVPARFKDYFEGLGDQFFRPCISPDGRWMAWNHIREVMLWRIGTTEFHECPRCEGYDLFWTADNRYCMSINTGERTPNGYLIDRAAVIDVTDFKNINHLSVPSKSPLNTLVTLCMDCGIDMCRDVGGGRDGHIYQVNWLGYNGDEAPAQATAMDISTNGFGLAAPVHQIRLPTGNFPIGYKISPSGKRVAWLIYSDSAQQTADIIYSNQKSWLKRAWGWIYPHIYHSPAELSLWISKFDGTEMKELGAAAVIDSKEESLPISDPAWLPDESGVSYVCDGDLYRVGVR